MRRNPRKELPLLDAEDLMIMLDDANLTARQRESDPIAEQRDPIL